VIQAWMLESMPKNMGGSSIGVLLAATIVVANVFVFGVKPSAAPRS
jgi:hypothetical protein